MNLANVAKGLIIGGLFFVSIFYVMDVLGNRARAQAQLEQAQAQAEHSEAEQVRERARNLRTLVDDTMIIPAKDFHSQGRFQIVPWNADASGMYGAYILDSQTGKLYHVVRDGAPSLIGQAQ